MRLILTCILVLSTACLFSQSTLEFNKVYTTRDGLSHDICLVVREDSRGFLWIGTWEGLSRFDGEVFKNYYHRRSVFQSLPNDQVWDVMEYRQGHLLVATNDGVGILNTVTGEFENDRMPLADIRAGSGAVVTKFNRDPDGNIWIVHDGIIDVFDSDLAYCHRFTDLDWAQSIRGVTMYLEDWEVDGQGRIWLPSDSSGIMVIDLDRRQVQHARNNPDNLPWLKHKLIRSIELQGDSVVWVSNWDEGLMKYDRSNGCLIRQYFDSSTSVPELQVMKDGRFFLGLVDGRFLELDPGTGDYHSITPSLSFREHPVSAVSICRTRDGHFWAGTTKGLSSFREATGSVKLDVPAEFRIAPRTDILDGAGRFYRAVWEGNLMQWDQTREKAKVFKIPGPCFENGFYPIEADGRDLLWVGTEHGLFVFDARTGSFHRPANFPREVAHGSVRALTKDAEGQFWIATADPVGIFRVDPVTGESVRVADPCLDPVREFGDYNFVQGIREDKRGFVWLMPGYAGGLIRIDRSSLQCESYPQSDRNMSILGNSEIRGLFPYADGSLWVFRPAADGLIRYQPDSDSLTYYSREDGLLSNDLTDACQGTGDELWLSASRGIVRFDMAKRRVTGSIIPDFDRGGSNYGILTDVSGSRLVLSGNHEILFLDPRAEIPEGAPPLPFLDAFRVNGVSREVHDHRTPIRLVQGQRSIQVEYGAITLHTSGPVRFSYSLSADSDEWSAPTSDRRVEFAYLRPGNYVFRVKTLGPDGRWSEPRDLVTFSIPPPFWRQAWFIALLLAGAGGAIYRMQRQRITKLRKEAAAGMEMLELEMKALQAQMNPHFIFNCINNIDALVHNNEKHLATQYLNKFARLIRNVLESTRQSKVPLSKDIETLQLYIDLESFRHEGRFETELSVDPQLRQGDYQVPPLVIQPFVENAILHGLGPRKEPGGRLRVEVSWTNAFIRYVIEDNGVGRGTEQGTGHSDREHLGNRMSLDRIRLFNKEEVPSVTVTDLFSEGRPSGTRVEVLLNFS